MQTAQRYGALDRYQVLGNYHLVALDGVWFYQSGTVHCEHCLHQKKADGETLYYHDMVAAVVVKHGQETVIPLIPEFIRNEDGQEKQDCERNAAKRWLESNGESYRWLNPVFLGDDLYADYPTCEAIVEKGMHFLFTCKPDSHRWLYDSMDEGCLEQKRVKTWTGRQHLEYRYRWYNGVELRAEQPTLKVNYLSLEIGNEEKGKATYRNSWVTDL
ncbi:MAG: ISNCY family transposase, partial [Treponema sp.]|nr:ISNCY family transposase [Treponema sp.]